jgi:hypothetical protein
VISEALDEIGVPKSRQTPEADVLTLMLHEDASFIFIPKVEADLGIEVPASEWEKVRTLNDVVEMLRRHLSPGP